MADHQAPTEQSVTRRVHRIQRCPKCGDLTTKFGHCFVKGPPLFPQLDTDTPTEPCDVVTLKDVLTVLDYAYHPQGGENPAHPVDVLVEAFGVTDEQYRRARGFDAEVTRS